MNKKITLAALLLISSADLSANPCPENIKEVWEESQKVKLDLIRKECGDLGLLKLLADGKLESEIFEFVENLDLSSLDLKNISDEEITRLLGKIKSWSNGNLRTVELCLDAQKFSNIFKVLDCFYDDSARGSTCAVVQVEPIPSGPKYYLKKDEWLYSDCT
jgi:hypothetical protein